MSRRAGRLLYPLAAVGLCAAEYAWALWLYGGWYRAGRLIPAAAVTVENLGTALMQHVGVSLPLLMALAAAWRLLGRGAAGELGFARPTGPGRTATAVAAGVYGLLLAVALLLGRQAPVATAYLWGYFLVMVAWVEEAAFRGLLPLLVARGGLPRWCAWVLPGLLWGAMHALMPMVRAGLSRETLLAMPSSALGYMGASCVLYALRRWSGSLWLPVWLHAALDFIGTLG